MRMLAKFIHGSYLYQLNTPESDQDFKGIYMPSLKDMALGKVKDSVDFSTNKSNEKNSSEDTDYEVYSIQKFVQLLSKGEMVTFDMLFAPEDAVTYYDELGNKLTTKYAEQSTLPNKPDIDKIEEVLFSLVADYHKHNKEFSNVTS